MVENLIPAYESTEGFTELYLAADSLTLIPSEAGPAMESMIGKIGNVALKNLAKALNDSIVVYNHWYSNATTSLAKYTNQVNATNRAETSRLTQAIKMERRQIDILKKQAHSRKTSPEDRAEYLNEAERLKLSVEQMVARNFSLIDNIFIPARVSELYRMGMDNIRDHEVFIGNYMGTYQVLIDKEDDLDSRHFNWDREDYAKEMRQLRNKTQKLLGDLTRSHNETYATMKLITAHRHNPGDELSQYPIDQFLKLNEVLRWTREKTEILEQRSRKHIQTVNGWMRDPKSVDMDDYQRITDEMYIFIEIRQACAQYLKIYMELMLRVLMKAQKPAEPDEF